MHAIQLFGLVILLTAQAAISQDRECPSPYLREMSRKTLLLFGDSLTQRSFDEGGWGARLASAYQRKADVIARGYSGYNTRWAAHILDKIFTRGQAPPDLVTVFFGANDAALPDRLSARQHVPVEEYVRTLKSFVQHIQSLGTQNVVLMTPPPVDEEARIRENKQKEGNSEATDLPERSNATTGRYAAAIRQLGAELGVPVLDLWTDIQRRNNWRECLNDGLHFTPDGNAVVYELLQATIDEALPHLRVDALPYDFPLHVDIDASDPASTFRDTAAS